MASFTNNKILLELYYSVTQTMKSLTELEIIVGKKGEVKPIV